MSPEAPDGRAFEEADQEAEARILSAYPELRELARRMMRNERRGHTLEPTALVHEAYLRLLRQEGLENADRGTILSAAARVMRHLLVDHARAKRARKREGSLRRRVLNEATAWHERQSLDLVALDEALERLRAMDAELAKIVELRFFLGLSEAAVAEALSVSTRTVERGWRAARLWLHRELDEA